MEILFVYYYSVQSDPKSANSQTSHNGVSLITDNSIGPKETTFHYIIPTSGIIGAPL